MKQPDLTQPRGSPMIDSQPVSLEALNGYFENLAAVATNKKSVLDDLVSNLTTLTTSNVEMADTIKNIWKNRQLQQQLNSF